VVDKPDFALDATTIAAWALLALHEAGDG